MYSQWIVTETAHFEKVGLSKLNAPHERLIELGGVKTQTWNLSQVRLSPAVSAQFTLEMCAAAKNRTKTPYFGILRSFKVIAVNTAGQLVSSACYDNQLVCVKQQK